MKQKEIDDKTIVIDNLTKKVGEIIQERDTIRTKNESQIEELTIKAQKAENLIQAYQSDKMAFNRVMDSMKNQKGIIYL